MRSVSHYAGVQQKAAGGHAGDRPSATDAHPGQESNVADDPRFEPTAHHYIVDWDGFRRYFVRTLAGLPLALPAGVRLGDDGAPGLLAAVARAIELSHGRAELDRALAEVVVPDSLERIVDEARVPLSERRRHLGGQPLARPEVLLPGKEDVAVAVAAAVHRHVQASLHRVVPQYLAACAAAEDENPASVDPGQLIPTHPMDRLVARALCSDERTSGPVGRPLVAGRGAIEGGSAPALRAVALVPVADAPGWLRAEPPDATRAEVAQAHFGDPAMAYQLVAAPPLFAVRGRARRALRPRTNSRARARAPRTTHRLHGHRSDPPRDAVGARSLARHPERRYSLSEFLSKLAECLP